MMRSRQIAPMALAGMATVVMACGPKGSESRASAPPATEAPASKGVTAASPSPMTALSQVKPVKVGISGPSCRHTVTPRRETFIATNRDAVDWQIRNNCASPQKVLICSYRGDEIFNPFEPCVSTPTGGLNIGTTFTVDAHKSESLQCTAKPHPRRQAYSQVILVGNEVPSSGCPIPPPRPVILTHELDVEIFP